MAVDKAAAAAAIDAFLRAIGRDPGAESALSGTGRRVADAFVDELCAGYGVDVGALLRDNAIPGTTGVVVLRSMAITTTCPHHLMMAKGTATVAFAPDRLLLGLGTLATLVDVFARRLALQEEIGEEVVAALAEHLSPRWAACRLVLSHGCMVGRGERQHGAVVETFAFRGDDAARTLALQLAGGSGPGPWEERR